MTKREQRRFVRELIANVQKDVLAKVASFPDTWDGIELRQYIADKFADSAALSFRSWPRRDPRNQRRYKDYKNTVLIGGL